MRLPPKRVRRHTRAGPTPRTEQLPAQAFASSFLLGPGRCPFPKPVRPQIPQHSRRSQVNFHRQSWQFRARKWRRIRISAEVAYGPLERRRPQLRDGSSNRPSPTTAGETSPPLALTGLLVAISHRRRARLSVGSTPTSEKLTRLTRPSLITIFRGQKACAEEEQRLLRATSELAA
jgi:hypothetical protein